VLTFLLPVLAGIERDAGDWQRAGALAVECVELSRDTGQATNLLNGLNECALLEARRGNEGLCERYAREALELAGKAASLPDSVYAHEALGVLALGQSRPSPPWSLSSSTCSNVASESLSWWAPCQT
jgi:hypothetical protein